MGNFKEIEIGCINDKMSVWGTEPAFRANLLFGYAQSDSERISFSGSTARVFLRIFGLLEQAIIAGGDFHEYDICEVPKSSEN